MPLTGKRIECINQRSINLTYNRWVFNFSVFANKKALLRIIARVLSPSKGRNTLFAVLAPELTIQRYWSLGSIKILPLPGDFVGTDIAFDDQKAILEGTAIAYFLQFWD